MTMIEEVSCILRKNNLKLCVAESFTGGLVASSFVSLAGASDIFVTSLVCYAEQAKKALLGVSDYTLKEYGAVSEQTVSEMLDGLKRLSLGDVFVATSGNAGPTSEKPNEVGLFYLGVMFKDRKIIKKYQVSGNRQEVINQGAQNSFDLILQVLSDI
ncbi:MAG: CinA family protein [Clostridiales bacterium]|nr:CinA family protein [Clostridiales bacterium]